MIKPLKFNFFLLVTLAVISSKCYSQRTSYGGLNFTIENASGDFRPGIGGLFERQITRHSGIETGVYYRNFIQRGFTTLTNSTGSYTFPFIISERHISIPVQYKFYSRLINLSAGPSFDFYLGWEQKNKSAIIVINDYNIDPNFFIGLLAKVSKSISLTDRFILEPEVRFNPIFTSSRTYIGLGIAGKYKL